MTMKNPIKFIQEVKQEAFKVTWPTGKETLQGALMVFAMALVMSLFFLFHNFSLLSLMPLLIFHYLYDQLVCDNHLSS